MACPYWSFYLFCVFAFTVFVSKRVSQDCFRLVWSQVSCCYASPSLIYPLSIYTFIWLSWSHNSSAPLFLFASLVNGSLSNPTCRRGENSAHIVPPLCECYLLFRGLSFAYHARQQLGLLFPLTYLMLLCYSATSLLQRKTIIRESENLPYLWNGSATQQIFYIINFP